MAQKTHDIIPALNEFRGNLNISQDDRDTLIRARTETRKFLRGRFISDLRLIAEKQNLAVIPQDARIRFLTQGSFAYHTINRPAHVPPQQMDMDDGVYFRASDIQMVNPGDLLNVMDDILGELAERNGWEPVRKPNCCRMILPATNAGVKDKHIDLPIYSIRDGQMDTLEEQQKQHQTRYAGIYEEWKIPYYSAVEVQLAHREKGWVNSDPRQVLDWVADMKDKYGMAFINVCRYLKAWRDHQWEDSPLSSIAIMAIVADAFAEGARPSDKDDDRILCAAKYFSIFLRRGVFDPIDDSKRLDDKISPEEKSDILEKAGKLHGALEKVLCGDLSKREICALLREQFGNRFPANEVGICKIAPIITATTVTPPVSAAAPYAGEDD